MQRSKAETASMEEAGKLVCSFQPQELKPATTQKEQDADKCIYTMILTCLEIDFIESQLIEVSIWRFCLKEMLFIAKPSEALQEVAAKTQIQFIFPQTH